MHTQSSLARPHPFPLCAVSSEAVNPSLVSACPVVIVPENEKNFKVELSLEERKLFGKMSDIVISPKKGSYFFGRPECQLKFTLQQLYLFLKQNAKEHPIEGYITGSAATFLLSVIKNPHTTLHPNDTDVSFYVGPNFREFHFLIYEFLQWNLKNIQNKLPFGISLPPKVNFKDRKHPDFWRSFINLEQFLGSYYVTDRLNKKEVPFYLISLGSLDIKFCGSLASCSMSISPVDSFHVALDGSNAFCIYQGKKYTEIQYKEALAHAGQRIYRIHNWEKIRLLFFRLTFKMTQGFLIPDKSDLFPHAISALQDISKELANRFIKHQKAHYPHSELARLMDLINGFAIGQFAIQNNPKLLSYVEGSSKTLASAWNSTILTRFVQIIRDQPAATNSLLKFIRGMFCIQWLRGNPEIECYTFPFAPDALRFQFSLTRNRDNADGSQAKDCFFLALEETENPCALLLEFFENWICLEKNFKSTKLYDSFLLLPDDLGFKDFPIQAQDRQTVLLHILSTDSLKRLKEKVFKHFQDKVQIKDFYEKFLEFPELCFQEGLMLQQLVCEEELRMLQICEDVNRSSLGHIFQEAHIANLARLSRFLGELQTLFKPASEASPASYIQRLLQCIGRHAASLRMLTTRKQGQHFIWDGIKTSISSIESKLQGVNSFIALYIVFSCQSNQLTALASQISNQKDSDGQTVVVGTAILEQGLKARDRELISRALQFIETYLETFIANGKKPDGNNRDLIDRFFAILAPHASASFATEDIQSFISKMIDKKWMQTLSLESCASLINILFETDFSKNILTASDPMLLEIFSTLMVNISSGEKVLESSQRSAQVFSLLKKRFMKKKGIKSKIKNVFLPVLEKHVSMPAKAIALFNGLSLIKVQSPLAEEDAQCVQGILAAWESLECGELSSLHLLRKKPEHAGDVVNLLRGIFLVDWMKRTQDSSREMRLTDGKYYLIQFQQDDPLVVIEDFIRSWMRLSNVEKVVDELAVLFQVRLEGKSNLNKYLREILNWLHEAPITSALADFYNRLVDVAFTKMELTSVKQIVLRMIEVQKQQSETTRQLASLLQSHPTSLLVDLESWIVKGSFQIASEVPLFSFVRLLMFRALQQVYQTKLSYNDLRAVYMLAKHMQKLNMISAEEVGKLSNAILQQSKNHKEENSYLFFAMELLADGAVQDAAANQHEEIALQLQPLIKKFIEQDKIPELWHCLKYLRSQTLEKKVSEKHFSEALKTTVSCVRASANPARRILGFHILEELFFTTQCAAEKTFLNEMVCFAEQLHEETSPYQTEGELLLRYLIRMSQEDKECEQRIYILQAKNVLKAILAFKQDADGVDEIENNIRVLLKVPMLSKDSCGVLQAVLDLDMSLLPQQNNIHIEVLLYKLVTALAMTSAEILKSILPADFLSTYREAFTNIMYKEVCNSCASSRVELRERAMYLLMFGTGISQELSPNIFLKGIIIWFEQLLEKNKACVLSKNTNLCSLINSENLQNISLTPLGCHLKLVIMQIHESNLIDKEVSENLLKSTLFECDAQKDSDEKHFSEENRALICFCLKIKKLPPQRLLKKWLTMQAKAPGNYSKINLALIKMGTQPINLEKIDTATYLGILCELINSTEAVTLKEWEDYAIESLLKHLHQNVENLNKQSNSLIPIGQFIYLILSKCQEACYPRIAILFSEYLPLLLNEEKDFIDQLADLTIIMTILLDKLDAKSALLFHEEFQKRIGQRRSQIIKEYINECYKKKTDVMAEVVFLYAPENIERSIEHSLRALQQISISLKNDEKELNEKKQMSVTHSQLIASLSNLFKMAIKLDFYQIEKNKKIGEPVDKKRLFNAVLSEAQLIEILCDYNNADQMIIDAMVKSFNRLLDFLDSAPKLLLHYGSVEYALSKLHGGLYWFAILTGKHQYLMDFQAIVARIMNVLCRDNMAKTILLMADIDARNLNMLGLLQAAAKMKQMDEAGTTTHQSRRQAVLSLFATWPKTQNSRQVIDIFKNSFMSMYVHHPLPEIKQTTLQALCSAHVTLIKIWLCSIDNSMEQLRPIEELKTIGQIVQILIPSFTGIPHSLLTEGEIRRSLAEACPKIKEILIDTFERLWYPRRNRLEHNTTVFENPFSVFYSLAIRSTNDPSPHVQQLIQEKNQYKEFMWLDIICDRVNKTSKKQKEVDRAISQLEKSLSQLCMTLEKNLSKPSNQKWLLTWRNIYKKFIHEFEVSIEEQYAKTVAPTLKLKFSKLSTYGQIHAAKAIAFHTIMRLYGLERSSWKPSMAITDLIVQLKEYGPHVVSLRPGLKDFLFQTKQHSCGWTAQQVICTGSGEAPHHHTKRVVVLAADQRTNWVYFLDFEESVDSTGTKQLCVMPYKDFISRIADNLGEINKNPENQSWTNNPDRFFAIHGNWQPAPV